MSLSSINPATEECIAEYPPASPDEVQTRLERARTTFHEWCACPHAERAGKLRALAALLRSRSVPLAELATREMGKPILQARAEVEKCAWVCEYYAELAPGFLAPRMESTSARKSYVRFDPLGTLLAIMPWNFPYWQVFRAAVPALAAGNMLVLKHASNVSGVALEIENLFLAAGFPPGAMTTLLIDSTQVEPLIAHPLIHAVTFTGSETIGRKVGMAAGRNLKPSVLELGGSDPFIVLADADIPHAAAMAVRARCQNTGQSCIAAKRFIVVDAAREEFTSLFASRMIALRHGDPLQEQNDLGPLARRDLRETLHSQMCQSMDQGAELLCGGVIPDGRGFFYPPTVLTNVRPGMPAFDEETFGPLAAIIPARDTDEAIHLANQSRFGLGASVWTRQSDAAENLARQIEAGSVFVNQFVQSDPHLPFGGIKHSGYGRELSREGMLEFLNAKTVWIQDV